MKRPIGYEGLNARSIEILSLMTQGLSDREIAERLVITLNTVKWYNHQIYGILGVNSRAQAIARAQELQLLNNDHVSEIAPPSAPHNPKHNLPSEITHFIGRKKELADVKRRLGLARLLTLVGSPWTGKTRLALRVAWEMVNTFRGGVFFVSLAPLNDPGLVLNSIASALKVNETPDQPLIETLKQAIYERHVLLVLDNFEHLLPAAPHVSELLSAALHLKVLTTSREPLHLYGEQEYIVPPLEVPNPEQLNLQVLADCESVVLFMQQAQAVKSGFALNKENALDIAKICVRLEGLPLAIELAAARCKLLTPQVLLTRLESRLNALTGGAHNLPTRQQTLRNTIEWSYNLLSDSEKMLFARLAVFRDGSSPEAIETICGQGLQMDLLESLLNKNLLHQQAGLDGEARLVMLETIHEYAWERLQVRGEAILMRHCHAEYFAAFAERAELELRQSEFTYWMRQLEKDHHNLLLALEWSLSDGNVEVGLRLIAALRDFWVMSGRFIEGERWTQRGLQESADIVPALRARVYTAAGFVLSLSPRRILAGQVMEQAVTIAREVNDRLVYAWALIFRGGASIGQSREYEQAISYVEEGLALFQSMDCKPGMVQGLCIVGELNRANGDDERALTAYEQALVLTRETGSKRHESMMLENLGFIAMHQGDINLAQRLFRESLIKALDLAYDKYRIVSSLVALASTISAKGQPEQVVQVYGAAEVSLERIGTVLQVGEQPEYERNLAFVRQQVDEATFQRCWNEGRALSLEQAVTQTLELSDATT